MSSRQLLEDAVEWALSMYVSDALVLTCLKIGEMKMRMRAKKKTLRRRISIRPAIIQDFSSGTNNRPRIYQNIGDITVFCFIPSMKSSTTGLRSLVKASERLEMCPTRFRYTKDLTANISLYLSPPCNI